MGGDLYFHRPRPEVLAMWRRTGFLERLGEDHVFPDKATALRTIYAGLDRDICAGCQARIFWECQADGSKQPEAAPRLCLPRPRGLAAS